jgi:hypothetical protein
MVLAHLDLLMARYSKYHMLPEYLLPSWLISVSFLSSSFSNIAEDVRDIILVALVIHFLHLIYLGKRYTKIFYYVSCENK